VIAGGSYGIVDATSGSASATPTASSSSPAGGLGSDKGDTLVMLAAYHGHPQTVSVLLERGADPGRPNDRGQTPLAGAVFTGERAVIEALIDAGADPTTGSPLAIETARLFGLDDLVTLFEARRQ